MSQKNMNLKKILQSPNLHPQSNLKYQPLRKNILPHTPHPTTQTNIQQLSYVSKRLKSLSPQQTELVKNTTLIPINCKLKITESKQKRQRAKSIKYRAINVQQSRKQGKPISPNTFEKVAKNTKVEVVYEYNCPSRGCQEINNNNINNNTVDRIYYEKGNKIYIDSDRIHQNQIISSSSTSQKNLINIGQKTNYYENNNNKNKNIKDQKILAYESSLISSNHNHQGKNVSQIAQVNNNNINKNVNYSNTVVQSNTGIKTNNTNMNSNTNLDYNTGNTGIKYNTNLNWQNNEINSNSNSKKNLNLNSNTNNVKSSTNLKSNTNIKSNNTNLKSNTNAQQGIQQGIQSNKRQSHHYSYQNQYPANQDDKELDGPAFFQTKGRANYHNLPKNYSHNHENIELGGRSKSISRQSRHGHGMMEGEDFQSNIGINSRHNKNNIGSTKQYSRHPTKEQMLESQQTYAYGNIHQVNYQTEQSMREDKSRMREYVQNVESRIIIGADGKASNNVNINAENPPNINKTLNSNKKLQTQKTIESRRKNVTSPSHQNQQLLYGSQEYRTTPQIEQRNKKLQQYQQSGNQGYNFKKHEQIQASRKKEKQKYKYNLYSLLDQQANMKCTTGLCTPNQICASEPKKQGWK